MVHDYLVTPSRKMQARLRKRGQRGRLQKVLILLLIAHEIIILIVFQNRYEFFLQYDLDLL